MFRKGLSEHPERAEVVQLQGEDRDYGQIIAERRIIRPAKGKPYLAPLEWINDSSVAMLDARSLRERRAGDLASASHDIAHAGGADTV
ncbi:hypothetical protein [Bradyrhizobium septentrionale]|uniref:Uncharacterized protein n=1 Tax=Bradyrhizobium septentrionale TaxID=1404411 RepID=A0ABZ2P953_9BRAD